ncbi:Endoplasmic reticulum mannosyl-oligosaccharide 1-2-alpha-mannosidase-like [Homarus americanus]|uniref:alpha-1,2-Mannosidase n=1 Tax=Homarus americanus TaxID=6706 RepID=A0A8J5N622_HOMAM|nr:Endoplasmic reticulum mannosyl-oligosaccharide 1-2-alpha-mannosidase-like [Homarus americanus]
MVSGGHILLLSLTLELPLPVRNERQEAVVAAMKHAWKGYKTYAWGHDHLKPMSRTRNDWLRLGLTLIDALDTLWIMDLKEGEYQIQKQFQNLWSTYLSEDQ